MKYTARYDPITGEIQGIFKGAFCEAENSIIVSQEIVADPHQYRFDGKDIVKKTQQEIEDILFNRQKWETEQQKKVELPVNIDNLIARITIIEQRLTKAGL